MRGVFGAYRAVGVLVLLLGAALFLGGLAAGSAAAAGKQKFTVYAVAQRAQFMNHADDRIRGMSANPFTPDQQALVIVAHGSEKNNGPFPGDDVLYTFKLYPSAKPTGSTGSALFTCYYTFIKRATCEAYFQLKTGLLLASGQVAFNSSRFTLAVTGGTDAYLGARGQVTVTPATGSQRLDFLLLSS